MEKTKFYNLSYGSHERHLADLIIPKEVRSSCGMIMIIHGGGWNSCDKSAHLKDIEYWSDKGYITATINYRYVSNDIHIPDLLDDIELAFSFLKEKIKESGYNVDRALMRGGSAGAHLCMMYSLTRKESSPVKPVAVIDDCGPVDFTKDNFLAGINGEFEDWKYSVLSDCCGLKITKENLKTRPVQLALKNVSPLTYIDENAVPMVLSYGKLDEIVPFNQFECLREALKKHSTEFECVIYENSGHELNKDTDATLKTNEFCEMFAEKFLK